MRKFTLIELLVVIAIIGILASMLLHSLRNAREKGKKAYCTNSLKQVGLSLSLYLDDNNEHFPPMQTGAHKYGWLGKMGNDPTFALPPKKRLLNIYLLDSWPPEDLIEVPVADCPSDEELYDKTGSSYPANTSAQMPKTLFENDSGFQSSKKFSIIESPVKFVTMGEHGSFKSAMNNSMDSSWYFHTAIGVRRWNLLFADSHVSFLTVNAGIKDSSDFTFRTDR